MENNEVVQLYLDDIIPNRFQPREVFDDQALKELAISIREHGVIQPILVRKFGEKYEIIAGERRYKASTMAGLTKIPAIIKNLDDKESSKVALIENLQRRDLTPIEEARTYQKILDLDEMTQEQLAMTMGKSQSAVSNKLRLLSLPDEIQESLLKEEISERHARSLLNVEDKNVQVDLLKEIVNNKMTVRELDARIKKINGEGDNSSSDVSGGVNNNLPNAGSVVGPESNLFNNNHSVVNNTEKLFDDERVNVNQGQNNESTLLNSDNNFNASVSDSLFNNNSFANNGSLFNNSEVGNKVDEVLPTPNLNSNNGNDTSLFVGSKESIDNSSSESLFNSNDFTAKREDDKVIGDGLLTGVSFDNNLSSEINDKSSDSLFTTTTIDSINNDQNNNNNDSLNNNINSNQSAVNSSNVIVSNNIGVAVNDIKNVVKLYQDKGYSINLLELDLDREIQLVIKFNKN